jgi:hypothetical protein
MFSTNDKNYRKDLDCLIEKLKNKEKFSFSKYADGELHILANMPINNGEFWFSPEDNQTQRTRLINSLKFKDKNYYVGVSCPCCIGGPSVHRWYKKQSQQELTNLTWANLFVNGNHQHYIDNMVPLYSNYTVVLVSNSDSDLENLPFEVKKHFKIGKNAWVQDYQLVDKIKTYISSNNITDHLFLFCAGPFGNILSHELFEFNKDNTYVDIGSTLNVLLLGEKGKNRGYLRGEATLNKMCVWSDE